MKFKDAEFFRRDPDNISTDAVRSERDAVWGRMQYLQRNAAEASRSLTADERRELDALTDVLAGLGDVLDGTRMNLPRIAEGAPLRAGDGSEEHLTSAQLWARQGGANLEYRDGMPLQPGQSFTGHARATNLITSDRENLSLRKSLRGVVTGDWRGADDERRAMAEGALTTGGYMIPTIVSSKILDLARNKARVMQAGATVVPMANRTLVIPKWATDQTAAWHSENAAIVPSDPTLGSVTLTANTLASLVTVSRELIEDTDSNFEQQLMNAFAQRFALTLDLAVLYGSGTAPEPRGVKNTTGITVASMGANGAAPASYDFLVDGVGTLRDNNEEPTGIIYSPRTGRELAKLKDSTQQPLETPEYVAALPRFETNQVPNTLTVGTGTTTSDAFVADWSQLLVGVRTSLEIQVLHERYADYGQLGLPGLVQGRRGGRATEGVLRGDRDPLMGDSIYCEHDQTEATCEACAYRKAQEAGHLVPPVLHQPTPEQPKQDQAEVDTIVEVDKGVGVLVMAGDPIPAELADQPRKPRAHRRRGADPACRGGMAHDRTAQRGLAAWRSWCGLWVAPHGAVGVLHNQGGRAGVAPCLVCWRDNQGTLPDISRTSWTRSLCSS